MLNLLQKLMLQEVGTYIIPNCVIGVCNISKFFILEHQIAVYNKFYANMEGLEPESAEKTNEESALPGLQLESDPTAQLAVV